MTPKWPCHVRDQRHLYGSHIHQRGPNFHLNRSAASLLFLVTAQCGKSVPNDPYDIAMLKVKTTHMHTTYKRPKFSSVSLYGEHF